MNRERYFKCIKSFAVDPIDDLDNEPPVVILKDEIWKVEFTNDEPHWIAYQVGGYGRLMGLRKEHWENTKYFIEVEEMEE